MRAYGPPVRGAGEASASTSIIGSSSTALDVCSCFVIAVDTAACLVSDHSGGGPALPCTHAHVARVLAPCASLPHVLLCTCALVGSRQRRLPRTLNRCRAARMRCQHCVALRRMDIEWRSNTRAANARSGRRLWRSCLHEVDGHVGLALDVLNAHLRIGARRRQPLESEGACGRERRNEWPWGESVPCKGREAGS